MLSVGHQLMNARQAKQLSIEDVAFETRIPHPRLRDMENDDLSNFANLTYAKGFLKLYSRFLKVDLSDYLDEFDTSLISDVTGHEYVHTPNTVRLLSSPAIALDDGSRARLAGNALGIAALTAVLLGGGWLFFKSPSSIAAPASSNQNVTAKAAAAESPTQSAKAAQLARADTNALGGPPTAEPGPAPKATIVPEDIVRKATPVEN